MVRHVPAVASAVDTASAEALSNLHQYAVKRYREFKEKGSEDEDEGTGGDQR